MELESEALRRKLEEKERELVSLQALRDYSTQLVTALESTCSLLERDTLLLERVTSLPTSATVPDASAKNSDA
jgi:hypothetical protein